MLACMQELKAPVAARGPASPMLAVTAGVQDSQGVSREQYWLERQAGSGSGQMPPDAGSPEGEIMHAALHREQSSAGAWGSAPGLHGAHPEPAGGRGWQDDAGDAKQSAISVSLQRRDHVSAGQGSGSFVPAASSRSASRGLALASDGKPAASRTTSSPNRINRGHLNHYH